MTKGEDMHSEMALVRQSDGINVIFDQNSPASSRSRSRSRSSGGSRRSTGLNKGRSRYRRRYRSSSSSSRSSSHSRSRSHPRCHRPSSRCRCDNHRRYGRSVRSPPRRYRAQSRSYSPSPNKRSQNHRYRSRSKSTSRRSRHRRAVNRVSKSPSRVQRSRSRSRSSTHSVNSTLSDKTQLIEAPKAEADPMILEEEQLELPESASPVLSESSQASPDTWVRQDSWKTLSQSDEVEPDDLSINKMSPKRKIICFSMSNPVVKPVVAVPASAKVTSRVDSYESRMPYGHWVPVKSGHRSKARKHTLATSH